MTKVDLHLHTTCSDGRLTPTQMVELVAERGLQVVAITDHDSTEGLAVVFEVAKRFPQLSIIPGIELSTDIPGNEIHVLGYFIDYSDADFQRTLREFRDGRVGRAREMVDKLAALGLPVDWERVLELAEGTVGRPHIAQAMVEKGYITYPQEAFTKYLGRNGLAYAEREKLTPAEAVRLITGVGGIPVLAHPREVDNVESLLPGLKAAGLVGMEVHYGTYSPSEVKGFAAMAKRHGLIACGGSDYHALGTPGEVEPGSVGPPLETAEKLYALAGETAKLGQ
ncbi:MAG: PHP domain-containing protein [Chloroflexi bacterium]|nr:PHP domain-containing protein [Chloroflexota bacterium]